MKRWMTRLLLPLLGLFVVSASHARAEEIGFIETFALAKDRSEALAQLIPGTEDHYYYHCLYLQQTEQFDKVDELLAAWIKRHNYTPRVREIQHRQALLTYDTNPAATLEFIRKQLNLQFNHQREKLGAKPNLPVALEQRLISRQTLTSRAKARYKNLQGFEHAALDWLIATELAPDRRRHLLSRLQRPDYANLAAFVVADLNYRLSKGFGSLPIHKQLLLTQLDECLKLKPDLLNQGAFVNTYLAKLEPGADADWRHDEAARDAYLARLRDFVARLEPVHNSLKAHVLYHRLVHDRNRGVYDRKVFLEYVRLPRNASYVNRGYLKLDRNRSYHANLSQDFASQTHMPPVGNDEPLVRSYLHHFFRDDVTYKPFEPYIDDTYLKHAFAETKIVNGLGEAERWYSLLPPAKYREFKERIDLDFDHAAKRVFTSVEPVGVDLYVKNVKKLLVKVYEVNTKNFYRETLQEVNTDIKLDGLIANLEDTHEFVEPPLRRVKRHFEFAQLNKPGVYVIDFIGNGKSSRMVVRKGKLRSLVHTTVAGHVFTVLDDNNKKVLGASLWMGGREYQAGEDGTILTPFSSRPGRQPVILSAGEFSSLAEFEHQPENYQLRAGMYVDRESLVARRKTRLIVRPGLYLNGEPVTLSVLSEPRLVITSVDHAGSPTVKEVPGFELFEDRESVYEFQTPSRLTQLTFTLTAKVQNLILNKKTDLAVSESFSVNAIDKSEHVDDLHFGEVNGSYFVDLLGRTGEVRMDRAVRLALKHRDFVHPVNVTLKTDAKGRVTLGELEGILHVTATAPNNVQRQWSLPRDRHTLQTTLHTAVGTPFELPYMGGAQEPLRSEFSLLELRGGFAVDQFPAMKLKQGLLRIEGLPPGDFDLLFKRSGQRVRLRVTEGEQRLGYAHGSSRRLELRGRRPLQIESVNVDQDGVRVQLVNADKFARVHIFATQYQPAFSAYSHLGSVGDVGPNLISVPRLETLYAQGRNIGDEYRYILDRRYATKFPGNMLERPSLLLNPWAIRKTSTEQQAAKGGSDFDRSKKPASENATRASGKSREQSPNNDYANLDFLSEGTSVLVNLRADKNGVVAIERDQLGAHQHLRVVAVDPRDTVARVVSLPESRRPHRDLRLVNGLDPKKHFTQQKQISVVHAKQKFELPDITTSKFETYDSLQRVFTLYTSLTNDPKLAEFRFVLDWPQLEPKEKREKYSKYACHELNFFLFKKDAPFFAEVVRPSLANKKDKTFLDRWLLGDDSLATQLKPWSFSQLNPVERILLSQRIDGEREFTARHIRELFNMIPPDVNRFNHLFNTAVRRGELDTADRLGFGKAVEGVMKGLDLPQLTPLSGKALGDTGRSNATYDTPANRPAAEKQSRALVENKKVRSARGRKSNQEKGRYFDGYLKEDARKARQLYRKLDKTQEWVENNYYHLPNEQRNSQLVAMNALWNDYAARDPEEPFLSKHIAESATGFPGMMFALSVLDIPFKSGEHETEYDEAKMTLTASSPVIVFHEEIRSAPPIEERTPILVSQNFFRRNDRYRHVNNQRYDKYVTDEFLSGEVYGCQIVVTNPTSSPRKLDLLLQTPVGSMPVLNGQATRSAHIDLQPFNTTTIEYYFYFPARGEFPHFPVHVSTNERLLTNAEPFTFTVVQELTKVDKTSWAYISQFGADAQVMDYLAENNLQRTDLERIAFRLHDKAFFNQVIDLLGKHHIYNHTLWSYGIKHGEAAEVREYLQHANSFVARCGDYIDSPLLTIDPVVRRSYEHRAYKPLVNARAHQLGKRRQILNDRLSQQYHHLLKIVGYGRDLDADQLMDMTYYMLLQDRIEEAIGYFTRVNPADLETRLQYDYFSAYLTFYAEDQQPARDIVARYADYPVKHWRLAFAAIDAQLKELEGADLKLVDDQDRGQRQQELASTEPSFEFKVESKKIQVNYQNLEQVTVNYYLMDIELMFSTKPFVQQRGGQFSYIRPNGSQVVKLPKQKSTFAFNLPNDLHNRNVLVEINAAGRSKTQAYYSNSLSLQVVENYGHLRVGHDRRPLPKAYVKVYAKMKDGKIRFFKDGYTDLRGRFDYTSLNTNELGFVERFSILVLSEEFGAVVREAKPPKQ